jgi:hypothetical protein
MLESLRECEDACIFVYVCVEREESADKQTDIHTEAETNRVRVIGRCSQKGRQTEAEKAAT